MHPNGGELFYKYKHKKNLIDFIKNKQKNTVKLLRAERYKIVQKNLQQNWRMALGLGNASVYNNGFTFHPVYGIPYIPGQALKGIVRAFIIREYFDKNESLAEQDPVFCHLFGCSADSYDNTERKGALNFFDAFPVNEFTIAADIMNSHYSKYYGDEGGNKLPVDSEKPNPIFFLSLKNATFNFGFYLHNDFKTEDFEYEACNDENCHHKISKKYSDRTDDNKVFSPNGSTSFASEIVKEFMIEALQYQGIGAKTAVGYGRFTKKNHQSSN
jgi:CRISPR-associated protein Cmr6